ncbi:MAG: hypothetical protein CMN30_17445 [Sandaracinus sp.]|nr:hypothetical protein [Sandaracinus sp.]
MRYPPRVRFALVLGLLLVPVTATFAQDDAESPQALFRQSADAYRAGDFAEAAALLKRAYAIEPIPILQYNLARALEGLGDDEGAIAAYRLYLEEAEAIEDRGSIEARIETLERQVGEREELAAAAAASEAREREARAAAEERTPPPPPPEVREPSVVPWIVAGAGVLVVGGGVVFGVLASGAHDDALAEPVHQERVDLRDRSENYALGANVMFGVGGAIVLAGAIWGLIDLLRSGEVDEDRAVGPGGLRLRF